MQTAPGDQATAQKAVYVVGDAPAMVQTENSQSENSPGASKLMRIYWFLGGR